VEFKMRPGTDEPVITEPTVGRTNYQNEIAVLNGVNIPLIAYHELASLPVPPTRPRARPVKLIDGHAEWRAALAYRRAGRLTLSRWWSQRRGPSRYMLLRASDPLPFVVAMRARAREQLGNAAETVFGSRVRRALARLT